MSNLGSSIGVALAGSVLVGVAQPGNSEYAIAVAVLAVFALGGLVAAMFIPVRKAGSVAAPSSPQVRTDGSQS